MAKIEGVVIASGPVDVSVMRRIRFTADCGCWHHLPATFELVVPGGGRDHERKGAYVRASGQDYMFRASDRNGPISIHIDEVTEE